MPLEFYSEDTVRTYDYTKYAYYRIEDTICKEDFEDKDADEIIKLLKEKTEQVDFSDYLKRYLYRNSRLTCPVDEVTEQKYKEMLEEAFEKNAAPYHFEKRVKKSQVIGRWLNGKISRTSMFVLGFGLGMTDIDVSEFLMKVLKEQDFNFSNKEETVYWFCYRNHLPYKAALQILSECESGDAEAFSEKTWQLLRNDPKQLLIDEINLKKYVTSLANSDEQTDEKRVSAYREFMRLYQECRKLLAIRDNEDKEAEPGEEALTGIGPADLEEFLYGALGKDENGNVKSNKSEDGLGKYLWANKLTRQRIASILKSTPDKNSITRYDLITLNFIIYSEKEYQGDYQISRCDDYIDDTNQILEKCGFYRIYPVNPYELLILICLVAVMPMDAFTEVLKRVLENAE